MKTAVKSETEPAQPSKAPANDKRNKKELLSCLLEQENANSNLEKQLKGMQKENTGLQEQHADASSIIGRKDHEAAQLLQQTKNNAIEIGQLQQENSELRDQILTTGQLEDQVTDDELKRKMRELASSITRWVVNHLSTTELSG